MKYRTFITIEVSFTDGEPPQADRTDRASDIALEMIDQARGFARRVHCATLEVSQVETRESA